VGEPGELVLDGEIMIGDGQLHLFDLPYMRYGGVETVRPADPFSRRRTALEMVGKTIEAMHDLPTASRITVVRQARTQREKHEMWEAAKAAGVEGVMVKHTEGTYLPGARSKESVKVKFVKTADVVVTASTRGRNEAGRETGGFAFAVFNEEGRLTPLGSCSAIGKPEVVLGDVIEVAYLYRQDGGSLVQPRMLRVRNDKEPKDCTFEQFPTYSREVI